MNPAHYSKDLMPGILNKYFFTYLSSCLKSIRQQTVQFSVICSCVDYVSTVVASIFMVILLDNREEASRKLVRSFFIKTTLRHIPENRNLRQPCEIMKSPMR